MLRIGLRRQITLIFSSLFIIILLCRQFLVDCPDCDGVSRLHMLSTPVAAQSLPYFEHETVCDANITMSSFSHDNEIIDHSICFASFEFQCFSRMSGGLGRTFTFQAEKLHSLGFPVLLLNLGFEGEGIDSESLKFQGPCAKYLHLRAVHFRKSPILWRGMSNTMHAAQLLCWINQNPRACRVLHVPDWVGIGALIVQAKRAGFPAFQDVHINVQAHGTHLIITRETETQRHFKDVICSAQERIAIEMADSVSFLTPGEKDVYERWYQLPNEQAILPNIVELHDDGSQTEASGQVMPTHLVFYGKLNFRKGLFLFIEGLKQIQVTSNLSTKHIRISLIGPTYNYMPRKELEKLIKPIKAQFGEVSLHESLDTNGVLEFFRRNVKHSLVVLPPMIEFQSFALYDVLEARIPFIASNIWAHRDALPNELHHTLLFDPEPQALGYLLTDILKNGILWSSLHEFIPTDATQQLIDWHQKKLNTPRIHASHTLGKLESKTDPRVTVAITTCDRQEFLQDAIDSIFSQQYPLASLDIIVVASCSHVLACGDLGIRLEPQMRSFECLHLEDNYGNLGAARNLAVQQATGDFVLFLDDDDLLSKEAVSALVRAANRNPTHCVFVSWVLAFEGQFEPLGQWITIGPAPESLPYANVLGASNIFLRRLASLELDLKFGTDYWAGCEDWELLAAAVIKNQLLLIPTVTLYYRKRAGSGMLSRNQQKSLKARCINRVIEKVATEMKAPWLYTSMSMAHNLYNMDAKGAKWP